MASKPTTDYQPAFKRVEQSSELDDVIAVAAMITQKTLAEVRAVATAKFQIPQHGGWYLTEAMIAELFAHFSYFAGQYKEAKKVVELPDLCLLLIDYRGENSAATGRHVLFHRQRSAGVVEYVIDPAAFVTDPAKQIRTDLSDLRGALWYMSVHPMKTGGR
jgi:hypothetical protein